jgi:hypothetical protein
MSEVPGEDGLVLDELGRERLAEGRQHLAALLSEHDRMRRDIRKGPLPGDIEREALEAYDEWEPADHFSSFSIEQLRCLLFAAAERLTNEPGYFSDAEYVLHQLSDRDLDLAAGDVRLLAEVSEPGDGTRNYVPFGLVVDLVEKLLRDGAVGAPALAEDVADQVLAWTVMVHHDPDSARYYRSPVADVRDKALELAGRPPVTLAEGVVGRDDGYGLAVIERLGLVEDWPAGVAVLLAHSAKARSARPSAGWQKVCRRRLDAVQDVSALLRGLLDLVVTAEPVTFICHSSRRAVLIGYNERLVRGLVWAAGVLDPDWLPGVLHAVAVRCLRLCYAGHILRFQQAYGLGRRRGWAGGFLSGAWDGGDSATARKAYPAAGLRASWAITDRGSSGGDVAVDLCLTGPVSFFPLEDQAGVPVPLADLPQEVFSEAMRDLDLIVSVTTVANDPLWLERHRGNPGLDRCGEAVTGDGLDHLRVHRHEMLTALGATPGDRFELTSTDLIVKGSLATYRIDLATANVRLDRTGKWLSFGTRLTTGNIGQYQLPGLPAPDDDKILRRILICAAILAADEQLAGRDLLRQIRG